MFDQYLKSLGSDTPREESQWQSIQDAMEKSAAPVKVDTEAEPIRPPKSIKDKAKERVTRKAMPAYSDEKTAAMGPSMLDKAAPFIAATPLLGAAASPVIGAAHAGEGRRIRGAGAGTVGGLAGGAVGSAGGAALGGLAGLGISALSRGRISPGTAAGAGTAIGGVGGGLLGTYRGAKLMGKGVKAEKQDKERKEQKTASLAALDVLRKHADKIPGGKADKKTDADFPKKQMEMGQKIEMEHTDDPAKAREISRDHLEEFDDYYTRLKKMEDEAEKAHEKSAEGSCPGSKIRSKGKGRGEGRGKKKGPMGVPVYEKSAGDMPPFLEQDRPKKVKEIYSALKRDHPDMPAEMKARIAARQGKRGKQKQGPPYKGPIKKWKEKEGQAQIRSWELPEGQEPTPENIRRLKQQEPAATTYVPPIRVPRDELDELKRQAIANTILGSARGAHTGTIAGGLGGAGAGYLTAEGIRAGANRLLGPGPERHPPRVPSSTPRNVLRGGLALAGGMLGAKYFAGKGATSGIRRASEENTEALRQLILKHNPHLAGQLSTEAGEDKVPANVEKTGQRIDVQTGTPGEEIRLRGPQARRWLQRARHRSRVEPLKGTRTGTMVGSAAGTAAGGLSGYGLATLLGASPRVRALAAAAGGAGGFVGGGTLGGPIGARAGRTRARNENLADALRTQSLQKEGDLKTTAINMAIGSAAGATGAALGSGIGAQTPPGQKSDMPKHIMTGALVGALLGGITSKTRELGARRAMAEGKPFTEGQKLVQDIMAPMGIATGLGVSSYRKQRKEKEKTSASKNTVKGLRDVLFSPGSSSTAKRYAEGRLEKHFSGRLMRGSMSASKKGKAQAEEAMKKLTEKTALKGGTVGRAWEARMAGKGDKAFRRWAETREAERYVRYGDPLTKSKAPEYTRGEKFQKDLWTAKGNPKRAETNEKLRKALESEG